MNYEKIIYPISKELSLIEKELINVNKNLKIHSLHETLDHFTKVKGKQLCPATLALLSTRVVNNKLPETKEYQLIQLAVFLELMHNESLVHDDVIDGDVIHSQAFSIICNLLPKEFTNVMTNLIETMCAAEIEQANEDTHCENKCYKVIENKSTFFMAISCELGAILSGGDNHQIISLEKYGYNLGMAYQIHDDFINDGIDSNLNITLKNIQNFSDKAIASIEAFENSQYKQSLLDLVSYT